MKWENGKDEVLNKLKLWIVRDEGDWNGLNLENFVYIVVMY